MNLTDREQKILILALVIIVGVSFVKWVFDPLWERYGSLNHRIIQKEEELDRNLFLIQNSKRYIRALNKKNEDLAIMGSLFYEGDIEGVKLEFMEELDYNLGKSRLALQSKDIYIEEILEGDFIRLVARFTLEGEMADLLSFLDGLNQTDKDFMISELQLRDLNDGGRLSYFVTINAIKRGGGFNELLK